MLLTDFVFEILFKKVKREYFTLEFERVKLKAVKYIFICHFCGLHFLLVNNN